MYGDFTIIESGGSKRTFRRCYIGEIPGRNEAWLRDLILTHPEILPIGDIDPTFGPLRALCAELRTEAGPIDAAFINDQGRLTIVECKLWKNPQARREVVGQILDYISAISRWSYADLQRQVSIASGEMGNVPYAKSGTHLREAQFTDAVGRSLREARMLALVVGDGIRDEVQRLAETLNRGANKAFSLGLIEVALYGSDQEQILVQPRVLAKTETIARYLTLLTSQSGQGVDVQEEVAADQAAENGQPLPGKQHLKAWWAPVIEMKFDDPEQDAPYWVGTNNVVLNTPYPGIQIKAYARVGGPRLEVFLSGNRGVKASGIGRLLGRESTVLGQFLDRERIELEQELPPGSEVVPWDKWPVRTAETEITDDDERRSWVIATLNSYVNVLRPRLRRWYEEFTARR